MAEKSEERGLAHWEPFAELERWSPFREGLFPRRLGRLFDELSRELTGREAAPIGQRMAPAVEISEDESQYTVTAELPGVKRDDVHVEMSEGVVTIRGEKRSEREEKKEQRRYVERSYGTFSRSFTLPRNADPDRIEAGFKDGVLTLAIPKTEEAKPRTINIKES